MCMPHLHRHTVTFATIIVPLTSWGIIDRSGGQVNLGLNYLRVERWIDAGLSK
jgi:hypothetical protein